MKESATNNFRKIVMQIFKRGNVASIFHFCLFIFEKPQKLPELTELKYHTQLRASF
jgi:hypothetical protein